MTITPIYRVVKSNTGAAGINVDDRIEIVVTENYDTSQAEIYYRGIYGSSVQNAAWKALG